MFIALSDHNCQFYFQNTSVLENHHWRSCIALLQQSGVFNHFDKKTWAQVEWQLRSLILATDITRQQEFLSRFKVNNRHRQFHMSNIIYF